MSDLPMLTHPSILLWVSASFYIVTILILWGAFSKVKNELMTAYHAFLYGMAFFHIFLGLGLYLNNPFFINLGVFAALTGSAFTTKFPLSSFSPNISKAGFYSTLFVAWLITIYMLLFPQQLDIMLKVVLGYMILVAGGSGLYTMYVGFKASESSVKVKCVGGGLGIVTCCLLADLMVLFQGVTVLGEILMSIAPVIMLSSLLIGRRLQTDSDQLLPDQPAVSY